MYEKAINILLVVAVIVPVVLLFWPFAIWNDVMSVSFVVALIFGAISLAFVKKK